MTQIRNIQVIPKLAPKIVVSDRTTENICIVYYESGDLNFPDFSKTKIFTIISSLDSFSNIRPN